MKITLKQLRFIPVFVMMTQVCADAAGDALAKVKVAADQMMQGVSLGCDVYGTIGRVGTSAVNGLVPGLRETARQVCCKDAAFTAKHPNVTAEILDNCYYNPRASEGSAQYHQTFQDVNASIGVADACSVLALMGGKVAEKAKTTDIKNDAGFSVKDLLINTGATITKGARAGARLFCCNQEAVMNANPRFKEAIGCK